MLELAQIAVAALIAGALDTIVGFGGGLLLLPILVATVGSTDAVILSAVIPLGWNIGRLPLLRSSIDLHSTALFALGILPGSFVGALFLDAVNPDHLRIAIGVLLVLLGLFHIIHLYVDIPFPRLNNKVLFPIIGLVAGAIAGLLGAGNGPLQSWVMSAGGIEPRASVAISGILGVLTGGIRLVAYWITGALSEFPWAAAGIGFLAALIGALAGVRLSRKTRDSTLKLFIGIVIVIGGIRMFF